MIFLKKAIRFYSLNFILILASLSQSQWKCLLPVVLMLIWFTWELVIEVKYSVARPLSVISSKDGYSRQLLVAVRDISIALPLLWHLYANPGQSASQLSLYLGLIFYVSGIFLRFYAMSTLKNYFTMVINVGDKQNIVTTGPYSRIRHPGYLALMMIYLAPTLIISNNFFMLLAMFFLSFLALSYRIFLEEKMLLIKFKDEYQAYCMRVKGALFPRG